MKGEGVLVIADPGERHRLQAQTFEIPRIVLEQKIGLGERAMRLVHLEQERRVTIAGGDVVRGDREAFLEQPLGIGKAFAADRDLGQHPKRVRIARVLLQELPQMNSAASMRLSPSAIAASLSCGSGGSASCPGEVISRL